MLLKSFSKFAFNGFKNYEVPLIAQQFKATSYQFPTTLYLHQPIQYNFVGFRERLEKQNLEKSQKDFREEMEFLANKPSFTMADYKQRTIDGLVKMNKGLLSKLQSGNEDTKEMMQKHKKILNAFFDDELVAEHIASDVKKQVAQVVQVEIADVNMMLKMFNYYKDMHKFLRKMKERGEQLPQTNEEFTYRFRTERPINMRKYKMEMGRQKRSKLQIRQRVKWGPRKKN